MIKRLPQLSFPPFADEGEKRTWLIPRGLLGFADGEVSADVFSLAGGILGFTHFDVVQRDGDLMTVSRLAATELLSNAKAASRNALAIAEAYLERLCAPRPDYAGLNMKSSHIMGIINTTPDSFSDGGDHFSPIDALAQGKVMLRDGANILDVGGESTRPGAEAIDSAEECRRILPVIEGLTSEGALVSADTRHTEVMQAALAAGASIINDVGGLRDMAAMNFIATSKMSAVVMHMQGEPGTMQNNPNYDYAPTDIYDWLEKQLLLAEKAGVTRAHLAVDPGFGFGKTPQQNMEIMASLSLFHGLGVPIVMGISRKSTLGYFSKGEPAKDRLAASVALAGAGRLQGVQIFRVHDVKETKQVLGNVEAMASAIT